MVYNVEWVTDRVWRTRKRFNDAHVRRTLDAMPEWQKRDIGWPADRNAASPIERNLISPKGQ